MTAKEIQVIFDVPPNMAKIVEKFPGACAPHIIFAYGDKIYVPGGFKLPFYLVAHETAHCERQQQVGVDHWWEQYLGDATFRYMEELIAHRAEYSALCEVATARNHRRKNLEEVAKKLAAPLYGRLVTVEKAKKDLKA